MTVRGHLGMLGVLCLVATTSASAFAQDGGMWDAGDRYVRGQVGLMLHTFDDRGGTKPDTGEDFTIGGAIGFFLSGRVSAEGEVGFGRGPSTTFVIEDLQGQGRATFKVRAADVIHINGNVGVHVPAAVSPYLSGGLGIIRFGQVNQEGVTATLADGTTMGLAFAGVPAATKFAFNVAGGVDLDVFRIEYRHFLVIDGDGNSTIGRVTAGFNAPL